MCILRRHLSVCECVSFPFGFKSEIWDLIIYVHEHCLSSIPEDRKKLKSNSRGYITKISPVPIYDKVSKHLQRNYKTDCLKF